ncbi:MAG: hypothetical protein Q9182_001945 [Xanthomendoza sp. 2 TL-2023]
MPPLHRPLPSSFLLRPFHQTIRTFTSTRARPFSKITLVGRLAADPEMQPTSTGQDIIKYAVGTNSGPKDNRQTTWWKVVAFTPEGQLRDKIMGLGKGSLIYLEGKCGINKFVDKEGNQQTAVNIIQRQLEVLERRNSDDSDSGSGESDNGAE